MLRSNVRTWAKASALGALFFGPLLAVSLVRAAENRVPIEAGATGPVVGSEHVLEGELRFGWRQEVESVRVDWDYGVESWELQISDHGWTWETVATGTASVPSTLIPVGRRAMFVKLVGRSKTHRWARIHELTAYARR